MKSVIISSKDLFTPQLNKFNAFSASRAYLVKAILEAEKLTEDEAFSILKGELKLDASVRSFMRELSISETKEEAVKYLCRKLAMNVKPDSEYFPHLVNFMQLLVAVKRRHLEAEIVEANEKLDRMKNLTK
jgi:hypothetical protein